MTRDLTSPGDQMVRRASLETRIGRALRSAAASLLEETLKKATVPGFGVAAVPDLWNSLLGEELEHFSQAERDYLLNPSGPILESSFAARVAGTVSEVLRTAALEDWTTGRLTEVLAAALTLDTPSLVLTAAGRRNKRDANFQRPAYESTPLEEEGEGWTSLLDSIVRDSATGLAGFTILTALRAEGLTHKRWITRHDSRVRPTHSRADGQTVPIDRPFKVGGFSLMYAGDRSASDASETAGCRCVTVGVEF